MIKQFKYSALAIAVLLLFVSYRSISLNISIKAPVNQEHKTSVDDSVVIALRKFDKGYLKDYIIENGHNTTILQGTHTLLSYATQLANYDLVEFLINEGEGVDIIVNDFTPLMICATNNYHRIANLLIKKGARIDTQNSVKNTALIIAARYGNLDIVKTLIQHNANPFLKNQTRQTAYDYAVSFHKGEVIKILEKHSVVYARKKLGAHIEGPYVFYLDGKKAEVDYYIHEPTKERTKIHRKAEQWKNGKILFKDPFNPNKDYLFAKDVREERQIQNYLNVPKIFAIGDVHGEYLSLVKLLRSNKIITNELKWNYQNGHLVFIGDIFDRGENVTEILWLIYRLEQEAEKVGGKVHYLLGNHELMIMQGDNRYVNDKYEYIAASIRRKYSDLYSKETLIGRWIRSKNIAITIDSILFTHAGISTEVVNNNITIDEMNNIINAMINEREIPENIGLSKQKIVMEENGPLWFRGYFGENQIIPKISKEEVEKTLKFYKAKKIVVGHTEVSRIRFLYDGAIIPINVPFNRDGVASQGLQVIGNVFYRCYDDGTVEIIE